MGRIMEKVCCLLKGTVHDLYSREKFEAIRELIDKVSFSSEIKEIKAWETAVISRELEQSTGVGDGVAIAHGKTEYAYRPLVFLGISRDGINYGSPDGKPVHFLFLIANHPDYQQEYLSLLSNIAKLASDLSFRKTLLALKQSSEIESRLALALNCLH